MNDLDGAGAPAPDVGGLPPARQEPNLGSRTTFPRWRLTPGAAMQDRVTGESAQKLRGRPVTNHGPLDAATDRPPRGTTNPRSVVRVLIRWRSRRRPRSSIVTSFTVRPERADLRRQGRGRWIFAS